MSNFAKQNLHIYDGRLGNVWIDFKILVVGGYGFKLENSRDVFVAALLSTSHMSVCRVSGQVANKLNQAALNISRLLVVLKTAAFDHTIFESPIQMFPDAHGITFHF